MTLPWRWKATLPGKRPCKETMVGVPIRSGSDANTHTHLIKHMARGRNGQSASRLHPALVAASCFCLDAWLPGPDFPSSFTTISSSILILPPVGLQNPDANPHDSDSEGWDGWQRNAAARREVRAGGSECTLDISIFTCHKNFVQSTRR
jgi:hypothetical protein